ncbi:unnamed protein product [marine sediment metagenome]|uniref:Uncharacterized protein n=1 Tax=marine sediment metagenome TaxID=412755 RepID=X1LPR5_9ZZZZ
MGSANYERNLKKWQSLRRYGSRSLKTFMHRNGNLTIAELLSAVKTQFKGRR